GLNARLIMAGDGVEAKNVRSRITTPRVLMLGALSPSDLERELRRANLGLVSQRADVAEFNLPSKLMNYMAVGLPVIASVRPESETARIVRESGAGWVTDARDPAQFARTAVEVLTKPDELRARGRAGLTYADANFRADGVAERFEGVLGAVAARR
ncbi:MAG: glycosyltransferase, partial [Solirubrobacteraceae bacterium]